MKLLVPDSWAALEPWIDVGVLGAFEVHAARRDRAPRNARRRPPPSSPVVLGAALALWAPSRGHACIDLADAPASSRPAPPDPSDGEGDTDATAAPIDRWARSPGPSRRRWLEALRGEPVGRRWWSVQTMGSIFFFFFFRRRGRAARAPRLAAVHPAAVDRRMHRSRRR